MSFTSIVNDAINDILEHGYDSEDRVDMWLERLRNAALESIKPDYVLLGRLRRVLGDTFRRLVERSALLQFHDGVPRFTLDMVKPQLRRELDRRIAASSQLIKLNRENMMAKTLQRFSGWATSVPPGGTEAASKIEVRKDIKKALVQLPYEERRVVIDQGHKLRAELSNILAVDGGAIAAIWHSKWRRPGYNYREDHKERDGQVYLIRGSWAVEQGLVRAGPAGYTDEITKPGEEVYCSCNYQYLYTLRKLPDDMLTEKGREKLK